LPGFLQALTPKLVDLGNEGLRRLIAAEVVDQIDDRENTNRGTRRLEFINDRLNCRRAANLWRRACLDIGLAANAFSGWIDWRVGWT
jgi:hypothetical protein